MSKLPDFSAQGYQVVRILGHNASSGRVVTLAEQLSSPSCDSKAFQGKQVVIKQFHFPTALGWTGFKAIEREIQVLGGLNHPGIPRYLGSFETEDGYCIVQEYKNAQPLSVRRSFDADQVKAIAIQILEILVYLQSRIPVIIHRDIKPENILVDDQLNVYLIDFGFARVGGGEVSLSSVAAGTFGFMAPEQLYNRVLTPATDLYGLGATLICLLTNTKSTDIDKLIDEDNKISFQHLLPKLSDRFLDWLSKLVAPKPLDRFDSAETALKALKSVYLMRLPAVQLSQSSIEFTAASITERLTQTITITNSIPETILEARWEVAPHHHDPPHTPDTHAWIFFTPAQFQANQVQCRITVDTTQLIPGKVYQRRIILHTNASPETYTLAVQVKTTSHSDANTRRLFYLHSLAAFSDYLIVGWAIAYLGVVNLGVIMAVDATVVVSIPALAATVVVFGMGSMNKALSSWFLPGDAVGIITGGCTGLLLGGVTGAIAGGWAIALTGFGGGALGGILAGLGVGAVTGAVTGALTRAGTKALTAARAGVRLMTYSRGVARWTSMLTAATGISWGVSLYVGLLNPYVWLALTTTHLPIAAMLVYLPINRRRLMVAEHQRERNLIKP
ncbi:MAG: protein kinase [Nostocaceae cyanobacterium]|nr:protein kinase [Nostocaceae cyanobacterium]